MTTTIQFLAGFICAAFLLTPAAFAQQRCAPHSFMKKMLADQFREVPIAFGDINHGRTMEFYRSRKGTWTVLIVTSSGMACFLATGDTYDEQEPDFLSVDPES